MPYIITTNRLVSELDAGETAVRGESTRIAVATLEEVEQHTLDLYGMPPRDLMDDPDTWNDSGGTIGPLPDGTVIEVKRVDKFALGFAAGLIAADHPQMWADADLIDKFNRTGRFSADPA